MRLAGRTALVTGGGSGIGRAIAIRFAQEGADVVVAAHHCNAAAEQTAQAVRAAGRRAFIVAADVRDVAQLTRLMDEGIAAAGAIDLLVNDAGVEVRAPFLDATEADYDLVLETNLKGPYFLAQAFARHRRAVGAGGRIINISSVHEDLCFPHFTSYCVSKGGLRMLTRNLAIELAPLGITVNNIAPGAIGTAINRSLQANPREMADLLDNIPLRRLGTPEDVAGLAAFLASADGDYITGASLLIDGGLLWAYAEQ
ncbi:SDR family NAD(P)-dependent oxidoreductase [Cupriavidus malaysiensis]|uniref:Sugar dehydrogenase n=1 Tax=Cupriavidus malaysiensis TaxID=367825 RepID=A0ABN4TUY8_9BURK|nr:glucose 1-dehydrogenase [Cupriavidus malaysiensis]AOZ11067.1 sugar dehydrogenase [Cupriavidus malaysiensis]